MAKMFTEEELAAEEEFYQQEEENYLDNKYAQFINLYNDWNKGGDKYKSIPNSKFNSDTYSPEEIGAVDFNLSNSKEDVSVSAIKEKALENLFKEYDKKRKENGTVYNEELENQAFELFNEITFDPTNEDELTYNPRTFNNPNNQIRYTDPTQKGKFAKSDLLDAYGKSFYFGRTEKDREADKEKLARMDDDSLNDYKEDLRTQAEYIANKNNGKVGKYDMPTILRCIDNITLSPKQLSGEGFDINNEQHKNEALFHNFITNLYQKEVDARGKAERLADVFENSRKQTAALFASASASSDELEGISDYRRKTNLENQLAFNSITEIGKRNGWFLDGLEYIGSTALSQLFNTMFTFAGGAIGGAVAGGAGAFVGGALGGVLVNYGEAKLDQYESFGKINYGAAIAQTTGYSILDGFGGVASLGRKTTAKIAESAAKDILVGLNKKGMVSIGKTIGKNIAHLGKNMVTEGITETAQSGIVGRSVHAYLDKDHSFLKEGETKESAIMAQVDEFFAGMFGAGGYGTIVQPINMVKQIQLVKEANDALVSTIGANMTPQEMSESRAKALELLRQEKKDNTLTEKDFEELPSAIRLQLLMQTSEVNKLGAGDRVALFMNLLDAEMANNSRLGIEVEKGRQKTLNTLLESETEASKKETINKLLEKSKKNQRVHESKLAIATQGYENPLSNEGNFFSRARRKLQQRGLKENFRRRKAMSEPVRKIYDAYTSKYNGNPMFEDNYTEDDYIVNDEDVSFRNERGDRVVNDLLMQDSQVAKKTGEPQSGVSHTDSKTGIKFVLDKDGITVLGAENMREPSAEKLTFSFEEQAGSTYLQRKANAINSALDAANRLIAYNTRYNKILATKVQMINDYAQARRPGSKVRIIDNLGALHKETENLKNEINKLSTANPNDPNISKLQKQISQNEALISAAIPGAYMWENNRTGEIFVLAERISSPLTLAMKLNHEIFHLTFRDFVRQELEKNGVIDDEMSEEERRTKIKDEVKKHDKKNEAGAIFSELHFTLEPRKIREFLSNFGKLGKRIAKLPNNELMNFQRNILQTPPYTDELGETTTITPSWGIDDVLSAVSERTVINTEAQIELAEENPITTQEAEETTEEKEEVSDVNRTENREKLYAEHEEKIDSLKENDTFVQISNGEKIATVTVVSDDGVVIEDIKGNEFIINKDTKEEKGYIEDEEVVDFFDEKKYKIESQQEETKEEPTPEPQNEPTKEEKPKDDKKVVEEEKVQQETKEEVSPKTEERVVTKKEETTAKEEEKKVEEPKEKEDSPTPSAKKSNRFEITTPDNELKIKGQYRIVDISTLTDMEGTSIQNRMREGNRNAEMQEFNIGRDLNPERVMESPTTDSGAPIVDSQGHILSGHGRTHGIQYAYEHNLAENYKKAILAKAKELGVSIPKNVENPVLIRELDSSYTEEELVDIASRSNQSAMLAKTAAEDAISDAIIIENNPNMIDLLNPDEEGNMLSADNVLFMRAFADKINDRSIRKQDGSFTDEADRRAKNAVLAYLFKDYSNKYKLLVNLIENASTLKMKRLVSGMLKATPAIIQANITKPELNIAEFLGQALDEFIKYRDGLSKGIYKSAEDYKLNATSMFGDAVSDEVLFAFGMLNDYANSAIDAFNFLTNYADFAEKDPGKNNIFGEKPRTPLDLMELAKEKTERQKQERKDGLFDGINYSAVGDIGAKRLDEKEGTTYRMDNLAIAKKMYSTKKTPEKIKFATGWELGADNKWRLEEDNAELKDTAKILNTIEKKKANNQTIYLSNIIQDNNVVKAYPGIKHLKVIDSSKEEQFRGGAEWDSKRVWLPLEDLNTNPEYFKEVLNHEVQHIIQEIEGFATGGNPQQFDLKYPESVRRKKYHRLAGEVEARNVGRRAVNLTDKERKNTLLERTEDVPRNKQLLNVEQGDKKKSTNRPTAALENSEIVEKQKQLNEIIEQIDDLKNSDVANDLLKKASEGKDLDGYAKWAESSGLNELISNKQALQKEIADAMAKARKEYEEKAKREEEEAIKRSGLSEADYFRKQAIKKFGYTPYFVDGGYILPNGKMLNFSGEKGKHFGTRGQDHRAISIIYADTTGTEAMIRFINEGNIRMMPESPGVEISNVHKPSSEQYKTIRNLAQKYADNDYFFVDFADSNGDVVGSLQYDGYVNPMRVINDIKHFYNTGEIRKPSNVFSFRSNDVNYASIDDFISSRSIRVSPQEYAIISKGIMQNDSEAIRNGFEPLTWGVVMSYNYVYIYVKDLDETFKVLKKIKNVEKNHKHIDYIFERYNDEFNNFTNGITDFNETSEVSSSTGMVSTVRDEKRESTNRNAESNSRVQKEAQSTSKPRPVSNIFDDDSREVSKSSRRKNDDVNYSSVDDAAYFDAINKGDMEAVQRMVDDAARKAGYVVKHMYHATYFLPETTPFREFDPLKGRKYNEGRDSVRTPIFFSTDKDAAIDIGTQVVEGNLKTPRRLLQLMFDEKVKPYVYDVYIKEGRDDVLKSILTYWDYENPDHVKMLLKEISNPYNPQYRKIEKQLAEGDWYLLESTNVQDALKELGFDGFYTFEQAKNLAVFDNKRIKSSAPITFDVNGNIIPLSQRFDFSNSDINYATVEDVLKMEGGATAKKAFVLQKMLENGEPIPEQNKVSFEKEMRATQEKWLPKIIDHTYLVDIKKLLDVETPNYKQIMDWAVFIQAINKDINDEIIKIRENNLTGREKELSEQYLDQLQVLRHKLYLLDLKWSPDQGRGLAARNIAINSKNEIFYLRKKMQELNANTPENNAELERLQKRLDFATAELERVQALLDEALEGKMNIYLPERESSASKAQRQHEENKARIKKAQTRKVNPITGEKGEITGTFEENLNKLKSEYDSLFTGGLPTERDMKRFIDNVETLLIVFHPELLDDFEGKFLPRFYEIMVNAWGQEVFPTIDVFRDFYDNYGVVPNPKVSEITRIKRRNKATALWLSKIADAKKGNVPKRTGRPYYKQSDEERHYAVILNHLLLHNPVEGPGKNAPIESKNPEQEIRTPQQQEIRRLENLIKDINLEIDKLENIVVENEQRAANGEPLLRYNKEKREQVPTNKTIKFLKEKLEELRDIKKRKLEEINGGESVVDVIKELEKLQESWKEKLDKAQKDEFSSRSKGKDYGAYTTPSNKVSEIEAGTVQNLISTIQTMKDDYKEILYRKNHPLKSQEELLQETIKDATDLLESLEKKLEDAKKGIFDEKQVKLEKPFENNSEVKALRFQIASTRKEIARLKRQQAQMAEITEEDIKQRHKALVDKIQKMTEKLKDIEVNGYTPDEKKSRFALVDKNDPRLSEALAKIKQLNKDINKAKKADKRAEAIRLRDRRLQSIKEKTNAYTRALSHMQETKKPLEKQKKGYIDMYQNDAEFMEAYKALQNIKTEIKRFEQRLDYENGTKGKKALHHIRDLATTSKLLRSSLDASFTWTQCAFLMLRNPVLAVKAVKMGLQAAFDPEFAESKQFEFTNGEDAYARIRAGLRISEIGDTDMSKQEEAFSRNLFKSLSSYINKNPVTGKILQASERAFVVPVNWLRVLTFDSLCEMHNKKPHELDEETAKTYAKWVNIYTGRGDFYGNPRALGVLNNMFWAPGLVSAHFQQATAPIELAIDGFDKEANKRVAKELILKPFRNLMIIYGLRMLIWALTKDEDDEEPPVDLNPISSNFLRIRIDDRWVSLTGGMEKVLSLTAQSIAGKKKNSIGKTIALRGPEADARNRTVVNEILNFFQNKVNPLVGVGMGALDGKERFGDYLNTSGDWMLYIGKNLFLPLPLEDMVEACEEEGIPKGLFFTALSFWGMKGASNDVNLYEKTKHKFEQEVEYSKGLTGEELTKYVQAHPTLRIKKKLSKLAREISKLKSQERKTTDKTERAILKDERESKENEFMLLYKGQ